MVYGLVRLGAAQPDARGGHIRWIAIRIIGGQKLRRHDSDFRRQERGAAIDDREPADRRHPDAARQRAAARRRRRRLRRILANHGVDITLSASGRASGRASGPEPCTFPPARIVDTTAPYELVSKMRASFWVIAPLLARHGRGQSVAARRLRHRHAAGRLLLDHGAGARSARRSRSTNGYVIARAPAAA